MRIGTDFSGIGSPEMGIHNLNIEHSVEFSCEIDKYAAKSYEAIHGKPKEFYNDITKRDHSKISQLDLYIAGFPCQAFSLAGKRKGFEEARGTLFFNVADFIRINQPKCFILENVKGLLSHDGGKTFQTIVSILSDGGGTVNSQTSIPYYDDGLGYHVYHQVLNTKDYGIPQNRERVFIVGFKDFRNYQFPKKEVLKLRLKDILESKVDEKYYLSDKMIKGFIKHAARHEEKGTGFGFKPKTVNDIGNALRANGALCATDNMIKEVHINQDTQASQVYNTQTLDTACNQGVIEPKIKQLNNPKHSNDRIYSDEGLSPTLNTMAGGNRQPFTKVSDRIRRLTPLECWRLQGFPDEAFEKAKKVNSDTQLYKQAGNSITVNVIQKVIENIIK